MTLPTECLWRCHCSLAEIDPGISFWDAMTLVFCPLHRSITRRRKSKCCRAHALAREGWTIPFCGMFPHWTFAKQRNADGATWLLVRDPTVLHRIVKDDIGEDKDKEVIPDVTKVSSGSFSSADTNSTNGDVDSTARKALTLLENDDKKEAWVGEKRQKTLHND